MSPFPKTILRCSLLLFAMVLPVSGAWASGEIGDHVNNLKAHIGEYEKNVEWFMGRVDGMVETYAAKGGDAVDTGKLIDWWEADLKYHAAIETQYPPLYASIWQGIYGVKQAIEQGQSADAVRAQRDALERALWQGLGAVKLAASEQASGGGKPESSTKAPQSGSATMKQIRANLDQVVDQYRDGAADEAKDLVHSTYAQLFEGVEGALIEQDADLVEDLEKDFNVTLPQLIESGAPVADVADAVDTMDKKLNRARKLLEKAERDKKDVF